MSERIWKANVTVAAVIERAGRFLLVEEDTAEGRRFNQPAGHLEAGETLLQAVVREVREETGHAFLPQHLLGVYCWQKNGAAATASQSAPGSEQRGGAEKALTFVRFAFIGSVGAADADASLDQGIVAARWLDLAALRALLPQHRSPLVMRCIDDYLAGQRLPLDAIVDQP